MDHNLIGVGKSLLCGVLVAVGGVLFSSLCGSFFNGLGDYGAGVLLGMGMYLCVVVVTCTGLVLSRLGPVKLKDETPQ